MTSSLAAGLTLQFKTADARVYPIRLDSSTFIPLLDMLYTSSVLGLESNTLILPS